jgi:hypothetical protein
MFYPNIRKEYIFTHVNVSSRFSGTIPLDLNAFLIKIVMETRNHSNGAYSEKPYE